MLSTHPTIIVNDSSDRYASSGIEHKRISSWKQKWIQPAKNVLNKWLHTRPENSSRRRYFIKAPHASAGLDPPAKNGPSRQAAQTDRPCQQTMYRINLHRHEHTEVHTLSSPNALIPNETLVFDHPRFNLYQEFPCFAPNPARKNFLKSMFVSNNHPSRPSSQFVKKTKMSRQGQRPNGFTSPQLGRCNAHSKRQSDKRQKVSQEGLAHGRWNSRAGRERRDLMMAKKSLPVLTKYSPPGQ